MIQSHLASLRHRLSQGTAKTASPNGYSLKSTGEEDVVAVVVDITAEVQVYFGWVAEIEKAHQTLSNVKGEEMLHTIEWRVADLFTSFEDEIVSGLQRALTQMGEKIWGAFKSFSKEMSLTGHKWTQPVCNLTRKEIRIEITKPKGLPLPMWKSKLSELGMR